MKVQAIIDALSKLDKNCDLDNTQLQKVIESARLGELDGGVLRIYYSCDVELPDVLEDLTDYFKDDLIDSLHDGTIDCIEEAVDIEDYDLSIAYVELIKDGKVTKTIKDKRQIK